MRMYFVDYVKDNTAQFFCEGLTNENINDMLYVDTYPEYTAFKNKLLTLFNTYTPLTMLLEDIFSMLQYFNENLTTNISILLSIDSSLSTGTLRISAESNIDEDILYLSTTTITIEKIQEEKHD